MLYSPLKINLILFFADSSDGQPIRTENNQEQNENKPGHNIHCTNIGKIIFWTYKKCFIPHSYDKLKIFKVYVPTINKLIN